VKTFSGPDCGEQEQKRAEPYGQTNDRDLDETGKLTAETCSGISRAKGLVDCGRPPHPPFPGRPMPPQMPGITPSPAAFSGETRLPQPTAMMTGNGHGKEEKYQLKASAASATIARLGPGVR